MFSYYFNNRDMTSSLKNSIYQPFQRAKFLYFIIENTILGTRWASETDLDQQKTL